MVIEIETRCSTNANAYKGLLFLLHTSQPSRCDDVWGIDEL